MLVVVLHYLATCVYHSCYNGANHTIPLTAVSKQFTECRYFMATDMTEGIYMLHVLQSMHARTLVDIGTSLQNLHAALLPYTSRLPAGMWTKTACSFLVVTPPPPLSQAHGFEVNTPTPVSAFHRYAVALVINMAVSDKTKVIAIIRVNSERE